MSQPDTISAEDVFHPDGMAALASLAGGRDDRPAWHDDALCAQTDPEAFFPEKGGSAREAKEICRRCPVRTECLADALAADTRFGVWGGLSERERRVLGPDLPVAAAAEPTIPTVPEPRRDQPGARRESTPTPGRLAGAGLAATLPTEPRGHRPHGDRPERPPSTFPDRARAQAVVTTAGRDHRPEPVTRTAASRTVTTRNKATEAVTRAATAQDRRPAGDTTGAAHATDTSVGTTKKTGRRGAAAAAEPTTRQDPAVDDRRDEPRRELRDAARLVLAGQQDHLGADRVDVACVLTLASAMADGASVADQPGESTALWEWRVAAVAAVISGTLTRGQTGRLMGERSQDVAHWVRRHLEGMELVEPGEQDQAGER